MVAANSKQAARSRGELVMKIDMATATEMIAATFLDAEEASRNGAVTVVEFDPQAEGVFVLRVRDDDWRPALAHLSMVIESLPEQGTTVKVVVFGYGIVDVAELYREPDLTVLTDAFAEGCGDGGGASRDDREELDLIGAFAVELEARNIALTFIGEGFTWIFNRSTSTFSGRGTRRQPLVPIMSVAHAGRA
jgi:hypothetical protein